MARLNQIIAIEKGIKARVYSVLSDLNKAIQKPDLFNGFSKTYKPNNEEGEALPAEKKRVQFDVPEMLKSVERGMSELIDVTARKDFTNCVAKADIKVDDVIIISGVPVPHLLFLEKQLTDLRTFISNLPVLDDSESWLFDANAGQYKTEETLTHRTKKVQRPITLAPATVEHAAQAQLITEDMLVGYWHQIKQSGAIPKPKKQDLQERVEKLLIAVKEAREAANMADEVQVPDVADALFAYLDATGAE